ncbi:MAG: hypothetical protein SGARI_004067 [Bacillariaceae sp.]
MKISLIVLSYLSAATAFAPSSSSRTTSHSLRIQTTSTSLNLKLFPGDEEGQVTATTESSKEGGMFQFFPAPTSDQSVATSSDAGEEGDWVDESKKVELILLGIWLVSLSGFILTNNFYGPWPLFMKTVPERVFFLSHMIGGMLFGGGIILTTCIERSVAKSSNAPVLQFWFDKVPLLDGLIVVPALTVSMISGTGLSIVRYGGLNIAPPHVSAIFWTLIAFMTWWGVTDLTTQGTALKAVNEMYDEFQEGNENVQTPKVVVDRHVSNVVSCFFVVLLYSMMVLKPGTLFPFPWNA